MNSTPFWIKQQSDLKNDMILYYDCLKSDIDLQTQLLMRELHFDQHSLLEINEICLSKINKIFESNLNEANEYFKCRNEVELLELEKLKSKIFSSFCAFFPFEKLKSKYKENCLHSPLGIFIISDWYLDRNQIAYLKVLLEETNKTTEIIKFVYDQDVLLIKYSHQINSFINNENETDKHLVYLRRNNLTSQLSQLSDFQLKFDDELCHLDGIKANTLFNLKNLTSLKIQSADLDDNLFSELKNLKHLVINGLEKIELLNQNYSVDFLVDYNEEDDVIACSKCEKTHYKYKINLQLINLTPKLTTLSISNCKLEDLNFKFPILLKKIENLSLLNCSITSIGSIRNLISLTHLNLSVNNLVTLKTNDFKGLKNLVNLQLECCSIEKIEQNAFNGLHNLKILNLAFNNLSILHGFTFMHLSNLVELNLFDCRINQISAYTFKCLINLKYLNIQNNKINADNCNFFQNKLLLN